MRLRVSQLGIVIALSGACAPAQEFKLPAPPTAKQLVDEVQTWDIRTVQHSRMFWQTLLGNDDLKSAVPPLPEAGDDAPKWRETVREHTAILQKRLEVRLGELPKGTLFLLDVNSGTLSARASQEVMQRLAYLAGLEDKFQPQTIHFDLEILELPTSMVGLNYSPEAFDNSFGLVRTLQALKTDPRTKVRTRVQWEVPPADRFMVRTGRELESAWRLVLHKDGTIEPMTWHRGFDSNLEAEAAYVPSGDFIELMSDLRHHDRPPVRRDKVAAQVLGMLKVVQPVYDHHVSSATTAVTLSNGATTLLGLWAPWQQPDVVKLACLAARSSPVLPQRREDLAKHLAALDDQLPATEPAVFSYSAPKGMEVRTYNCRFDLLGLSLIGGPVGANGEDSDQRGIEFRRTAKLVTTREMLISQGIPFPEGSWAVYHRPSHELVVAQSPEWHEHVLAFVEGVMANPRWNTVATLHLVEGSAETIRGLEKAFAAPSTEEVAWADLQMLMLSNRLKRVGVLRAAGHHGTIYGIGTGPVQTVASGIRPGPGEYKDDGSPPVEGVAHVDLDEESFGTRFEAEFEGPPDGDSFVSKLDLLHHLPSKPGAPPRFHHLVVTLPVQKAVPKLIGIWPRDEPSGKGEGGVMQAAFLRVDTVPVVP